MVRYPTFQNQDEQEYDIDDKKLGPADPEVSKENAKHAVAADFRGSNRILTVPKPDDETAPGRPVDTATKGHDSDIAQSDAKLEAEQGFRKADAELNSIYKQLQSRLESTQAKGELAKAQREWIAFRDAESTLRAGLSSGGGSAYLMDRMSNQAELTEIRTRQLKAILSRLP